MTENTATIITGAASGIGAAVSLKLARLGASLTLHTRHATERLEAVASKARSLGAEVETVLGDLAEPDVAVRVVHAHEARFGALDALVANAGFPLLTALEDMSTTHFEETVRACLV